MKKRGAVYRLSTLSLIGLYIAILEKLDFSWYAVVVGAIPNIIFNVIWESYFKNKEKNNSNKGIN